MTIFDARLPDGSGIDACREVRSVDPTIKGLVLTSYDDELALTTAILAGASGFSWSRPVASTVPPTLACGC